ncbi:MAG: DUF934 domain-containing protein [Kiloniellales bacterium]
MPLIKDGRLAEDAWIAVGDDEPLPADRPALISLGRWQAEREALLGRNAPLGLRLRSDQSPRLVAADVSRFRLLALEFPKLNDGRAFSYARLLRERYGFSGEIRAVGHLIRDQFAFLTRCGFDAVEVKDATLAEQWHDALAEFSVVYQPATDSRRPAFTLRRTKTAAE